MKIALLVVAVVASCVFAVSDAVPYSEPDAMAEAYAEPGPVADPYAFAYAEPEPEPEPQRNQCPPCCLRRPQICKIRCPKHCLLTKPFYGNSGYGRRGY